MAGRTALEAKVIETCGFFHRRPSWESSQESLQSTYLVRVISSPTSPCKRLAHQHMPCILPGLASGHWSSPLVLTRRNGRYDR